MASVLKVNTVELGLQWMVIKKPLHKAKSKKKMTLAKNEDPCTHVCFEQSNPAGYLVSDGQTLEFICYLTPTIFR